MSELTTRGARRAFLIISVSCLIGCSGEDPPDEPPTADASVPDAGPTCGNGIVDPGETCDGDCPVSCDDSDPCTTDALIGEPCQVSCTFVPVTLHVGGDQCCPPGATAASDPDCASVCGNGTLEPTETCDTAIAAGAGACPSPADCSDGVACTEDVLEQAQPGNPCTTICLHREILERGPVDGCCPSGATVNEDGDCSQTCGDGVVGPNERCDTGIGQGAGRCPMAFDCDDQDPCTIGQLVSAGTCSAECIQTPVTGNLHGDGCCLAPDVTAPSEDSDCPLLPEYNLCQLREDCASGDCRSFDAYQGASACTTVCDAEIYPMGGGCPPSPLPDAVPACITRPKVGGSNEPRCILASVDPYVATDPDGGALIVGGTLVGSAQAMDDLDLYYLPGVAGAPLVEVVVTPNAGLDTYLILGGEELASFVACNTAPSSQADVCTVTLPDQGGRTWVYVASAQGTGGYSISVSYAP